MANFDLSKYNPVHSRIAEFYEKYSQGRIVTEAMALTGSENNRPTELYYLTSTDTLAQ